MFFVNYFFLIVNTKVTNFLVLVCCELVLIHFNFLIILRYF